MKETERLIQLITRFGPSKLPLLNQATPKTKTLEDQLFENIKTGKYKNEEEALLDLYGSEDDYHKYRMLKSRLKQKLYNHVLFAERNTIIAKREEKQCLDWAYRGKSLLLLSEYYLARKQFEKAIKLAIQYEFTEIVIDCLEKIEFISTQTHHLKLYVDTSERLDYFRGLKSLEEKAHRIYYDARFCLLDSISAKKKYLNNLPEKIAEMKILWKKSKSYNIFQKYYMMSNLYFEHSGKFEGEVRNIQLCEKLLKEGKINKLRFDSRLNKYLMVYALLRTKKIHEGLSLVGKYSHIFPVHSRNWFAFKESHFLLAVHAGNYVEARNVVDEVDLQISKLTLNKIPSENWRLYKAYLNFISHGNYGHNFNFSQFINTVPTHTKDKNGHNISILILQFLNLLKKGDYEQLTSKEETYRKYVNTYLKDPYSKRSYYLFKLMLCIIRADFDWGKSVKKGKNWLEKLENTPEPGDAYSSIEIVPYEKLWEVMLDYLRDK